MFPEPQDGFAELVEQLPLGVVELSPDGAVKSANENARLLISGQTGADLRPLLARLAKSAWVSQHLVEHTLALGRLGEVRLWAAPTRGCEGVMVVLERHATARSRLESKLLSMLLRAAAGGESWHTCATRALEALCASLPASHLLLYELAADRTLTPSAHAGLTEPLLSALRPLSPHPAELVGRCFTSGQMQVVSPVSSSPLVLPFAYPAAQPLAAVVVPLKGEGGPCGVFYACGPEAVLQEPEARLLLGLAEMLSLLLGQKARDQRILSEHNRFSSLLDNLPDAVLEVPESGQVALAGGAASAVFGRSAPQLQGLPWVELVAPDHRESALAALAGSGHFEVEVQHPGGARRKVSVAAHAADDLTRLVFRDVTKVKELEAQAHAAAEAAHRNERLAVLGRLAAGVGHELNNPLAYLRANMSELRAVLDDVLPHLPEASVQDVRAMIDDCDQGVKALVNIVSALKGSSRQSEPAAGVDFDPAVAVQHAITLFRGVNKVKAKVEWERPSLPLVTGSSAALSQVVLNIMQNALDAMGTGTIRVSAGVASDEGQVVVEIADGGPGIPPEVQARLFEPFYTTKGEGVGTGLGLYMSRELLNRMGAELTFVTGPKGTCFKVCLPIAHDEARV